MGDPTVTARWTGEFVDAVARHRAHPDTFPIPPEKKRRGLRPGDFAKVGFEAASAPTAGLFEGATGERMWVRVVRVFSSSDGLRYEGILDNDPAFLVGLLAGDMVTFTPSHVLAIERP